MTSLALRHDGRGTATVPRPRRRLLGLVVALVVLVVLLVLSVMIGSTRIPPSAVWDALFHPSADIDQFAIRDFRLPRTIVGLVVGVALGLSGALIQALTRNGSGTRSVVGRPSRSPVPSIMGGNPLASTRNPLASNALRPIGDP